MAGNITEVKIIGANEPILLDNPNEILLVRKGFVDVFATFIDQNKNLGKRFHLFRVPTSSAIFGIESSATNIRLLAVALNEVQIQRYPATILLPEEQTDALQKQKLAIDHLYLLEDWIKNLIKAIAPQYVFPKNSTSIVASECNLAAGEFISILDHKLHWIKVKTGKLFLNCQQTLRITAENGFYPITAQSLLQTEEDSTLQVVSSIDWLTHYYSPMDLPNFYHILFSCLHVKLDNIEAKVTQDILEQKHIDELVHRQSLKTMESLLLPQKSTKIYTARTPLLQAIQKIADLQNCIINLGNIQPPEITTTNHAITIQNLANQIGIRSRKILLRGNWWKKNSIPMLAFTKDEKICVLEPKGTTRFRLHYISEESSVIVDKEVASTIIPEAFVLYMSGHESKLKWQDFIIIGCKKNIKEIMRILLLGLSIAALGAITPIITGIVFNQVVPENDISLHFQIISLLIISLLTTAVFNAVQVINKLRLKIKIDHIFQTIVWDRILRFPITFFKSFTIGDLAYRATSVGESFRALSDLLIRTTTSIIFVIVTTILLFYYQTSLAIVAITMCTLSILVQIGLNNLKARHQKRVFDLTMKTDSLSQQYFSNIAKIRNNVSEERAYAKWINLFTENSSHLMRSQHIQHAITILNSILNTFAIMLFFGIIVKYKPSISPGNVIAFLSAFALFYKALLEIAETIQQTQIIAKTYQFIKPIFETTPEDIAIKTAPNQLIGNIEIKNLTFKYGADLSLTIKNISFHIHPGEFVAIVGPSGCGKSTLLRLLLNFEQPTSGEILYDGINIDDIDIRALRRQFGVVLQNSALATANIYENISSADPSITLEDAWEASKFAGIDRFISSLPMQMHTLIMEGGAMFSGGQRQQLMIARAIARKAPILFLDEASSALDNKTQELVSRNLKKLTNTRIIVAHRLSTIINADTIYVMREGSIVQQGNYAQLINDEHGLFAKLAKRQLL